MTTDAAPPDYDSIPDTRDLEPPAYEDLPLATLANAIAIRALRRDVRAMQAEAAATRKLITTWGLRIVVAIVSGGVTMAGATIAAAVSRGEEVERQRHLIEMVQRNDGRITKLEERQWGRD